MKIETSARLHLSLIDLNGSEGRIDGGIGITLKDPTLEIECIENDDSTNILFDNSISKDLINKEYSQKILEATNNMKKYLSIDTEYTFKINKIYPIHHGLGLGTQLLLSVGQLISQLNDTPLEINQIAKIIQRGGTSGIGVESFNHGGFIVDGGHKKNIKKDFLPSSYSTVSPPPILARYDFPKKWNIILVIPDIPGGASGKKEKDIFQSYTPININDVEKISYLTLMKLMPAVIEEDLQCFSDAINKIQELGFKKIEKNLQYPVIHDIINYMKDNGIETAGMSSFGPTCFGITDSNIKYHKRDLEDMFGENSTIIVTNGKNHGSKIIK